ncbi:hypothetical protein KXW29_004375 [Aspergillus fumigatus]|nr:hypothetical protein KXW90_002251 [Aspergillus fumigatus]KAH2714761.1 hypothetical protein KXW29_004375 [Aspergillus fumigatus]KAH2799915.1 hypothetical protein KXV23_003134 [Aspergillus fumigatus]KAH2949622.1 hypothetical protein KXW00_004527 [Aspergillus fumigatus]KAH3099923.1 hypothetical protein KXW41_003897 [Aspergillus fumigatus]
MSKTPQPPLEVIAPQAKLPVEQNQKEGSNDQAASPQPQLSKWRKLNPLRLQNVPPVPSERQVTREYGANILSRIFFEWMTPFMKVGYLRPLEPEDIWTINPDRAVDTLSAKLGLAFKKRIEQGSKKPLARALIDTLKHDLLIGGICQLVGMMCMILSPYVVRHLITFSTEAYAAHIRGIPGPHIGPGLGYAFGLYAMQVLQSLTMNQALYRGMVVGGMAKAGLTSQIFAKAMRLSNRARAGGKQANDTGPKSAEGSPSGAAANDAAKETAGWSNGRITTLLGVDVDRIDTASGMLHMLWVAPIGLIVALIILIVNIGYSALAGYALLVVGVFALAWAMRLLVQFRRAINKITDQRVTLTREILYSVRFVKFFGWESSFLKRLEAVRNREIGSIKRLLFVRHAVVVCMVSLPTFASLLSFVTYALSDHSLSPDRIFASLALFNVLRMPLIMLNLTITQMTDAWTAMNRIQEFLQAEEKSDPVEWDTGMDKAIEVEHASFTWEQVQSNKGEEKKGEKPKRSQVLPKDATPSSPSDDKSDTTELVPFKLTDINFEVGRGELLAVIGTVGSGKSSLLGALAGDMRLTEGKIRMGATRSFCPQYAWIQNVSVRENILFGSDYDEEFYDRVIDACALRADLDIFPNGDQTEIGERGITVSGGQKQRINIARAVYSKADIILMDDPLSAVDAHVGRHIMDKAICGLLKDKCRVLATHQLHVLSRCDRIIVMNEGRIDAIGTFDDLVRTNEHFRELMSSTSQQEKQSDDDDVDKKSNEGEPLKDQIDKARPAAALMSKEELATGSVGWPVWKAYITASGSFFLNFIAFLVLLACLNGGLIMTGLWVSYWTSDKFPNLTAGQYMGIYAGICAAQALALYGFALHVTIAAAVSSKTMLHRAMYRVLRAPMAFFDTTPLGRITNRFSRDVQVMDSELGESIRMFAFTFTQILATMGLIIAFYHYVLLLRSTVFSRFGEAITGVASIQAYRMEGYFQRNLHESIDSMNGAYFLTFSNQRWLSIRLDAIGSLMILVVGILVVTSRFNVGPSISGLVLSYVLNITLSLQFTIRQFAEVGNNMNAAERIHYYGTSLDQEAPLQLAEVPPGWPEKGRITFSDVQMRYRDGLPLVLKGLTMDVRGGERIGIVGRTGAGKSSIMAALFRLTELSGGSIKIDDIDIATVGLRDLRTRLAIIPQDPTLFRGTIRSNLDPFNEHTDLELWAALRKAHLVGQELPEDESQDGTLTPSSMNEKQQTVQRLHLDTIVEEEGHNFSLGQRQLMALARALVRDARIIICDEATSSVDFETDQKVQETMAQGFQGKTLLCIAHRLRTIINYDRICVMDQGQIAEFDTPLALWEKPDGIFRKRIRATTPVSSNSWSCCTSTRHERTPGNVTALQAAVSRWNIDIVRLLLEWGADVNAPANKHKHGGKPALQTAAPENHRVMTDLLVHQGAGVNGVPSPVRGRTALQEAASSGYVQLSEYLLAHGADADALAEHLGGVTALQGAATRGNIRIVMMLRPAGVDVHGAAAENGRLDTLHL